MQKKSRYNYTGRYSKATRAALIAELTQIKTNQIISNALWTTRRQTNSPTITLAKKISSPKLKLSPGE